MKSLHQKFRDSGYVVLQIIEKAGFDKELSNLSLEYARGFIVQ